MIEDMNDDPMRDKKNLLKFQNRLAQCHEEWQRRNPGRKATNEWYGFTKSAI